ncbi:hypothetical protein L249_5016 [Ophiocordyceps polyrhachis-furcata BCC 54312]|uniref:U6 small nuclear RNA (adenine-(43)-N(6))-methyltransferase n=1 Tax=Ophiocordyceps polyrhachis-furcata BCC 54312 TaxID=1330021 RepID=A0A367L3H8_9HYPO|nr:hypothetical protein L249_5016 [Ophiocordyceps polyrhachis-furcata BCC 54312]
MASDPRAQAPSMASIKASCHAGLHELARLQDSRRLHDGSASAYELECLISGQSQVVISQLRSLEACVRRLAREAEAQRWRRWLLAGALHVPPFFLPSDEKTNGASRERSALIPTIRAIFRRRRRRHQNYHPAEDSRTNDTEHAFRRSLTLMARIRNGVLGRGGYVASVAMFVLGLLVVFRNEVLLRVARTVYRRLRRLCEALEGGVDEDGLVDGQVLEGWRWRRKLDDAQTPPQPPHDTPQQQQQPEQVLATRDRRFQNLYSDPPDFKRLAQCDPAFAAVVKNGRSLDFGDPASVMQLSKTLLKLDFGLELVLPDDRLCPPIPNRHSYILWLKGLLDTSSYNPPGQRLVGLDIGTGASCIYPLLGCVQRPWSFIATDIDIQSLAWARKNVQLNKLDPRIRVIDCQADDDLIPLRRLGLDSIDFVMTNPPFYASEAEMLESARRKARPPWTACTGSRTEMVVEGGEVAFVGRMLDESLVLGRRVRWYSAMVGFYASVITLVGRLKAHGIGNYAVVEFAQGPKTRRWAVAWSFGPMRPSQAVARGISSMARKAANDVLPSMTEVEVASLKLAAEETVGDVAVRLRGAVEALELMSWTWDEEAVEGTGRAADRVWSRAWRRRRKKREVDVAEEEEEEEEVAMREKDDAEPVCVLGFKIELRLTLRRELSVRCRWLEGVDAVAFESFHGFLQAAVGGR